MNLVLLFSEDFVDERRVVITGRRFVHINEIHRASVGDRLVVGLAEGRIGAGVVTRIESTSLEMVVELDSDPPPPLPLSLLLALPRPKMLSRVIETATAMGVKTLFLINSARVEKSFWQSHQLRDDILRSHLTLGLEQAKDTRFPRIQLRKQLRSFLEDELPAVIEGTSCLVAHPDALADCPRKVDGPVTLAIGPEGGFLDSEIAMFEAIGFAPVNLGRRILRVESVIPAILGRLF
ncbi:MAG TPA: 16S rRNA (uracil(1498)-N(3))-methyltransferase [Thermoanaerobaculia bacterium]|nr:16S rRNA (uracil(1498)-N(3))-methyltransferase [Thermoanaerobaculia bacterium]